MEQNHKAYILGQNKKGLTKGEIAKDNKGGFWIPSLNWAIDEMEGKHQAQQLIICSDAEIRKGDSYVWTKDSVMKIYIANSAPMPKESFTDCQKIIASRPHIIGTYQITDEDVKWFVENNCPSDVELVMVKVDEQLNPFGGFDEIYQPKINNNCIELVKEKKVYNGIATSDDYLDEEIKKENNESELYQLLREFIRSLNSESGYSKLVDKIKGYIKQHSTDDKSQQLIQSTQPQASIKDVEEAAINSGIEYANRGVYAIYSAPKDRPFIDRDKLTHFSNGFKLGASWQEQNDAVEFAEWIANHHWQFRIQIRSGTGIRSNVWESQLDYSTLTTSELYKIFLTSKSKT